MPFSRINCVSPVAALGTISVNHSGVQTVNTSRRVRPAFYNGPAHAT